jgi:hypothetical protein
MQNVVILKKLTCKGTLRQGLSVWGPEPHTHPHYILYIRAYSMLNHRGNRGRGDSWIREKGSGAAGESTDHKAGFKIPTWRNVRKKSAISSLWTLINTCSKVPLQVNFFRWRIFALSSMSLIFLRVPWCVCNACDHKLDSSCKALPTCALSQNNNVCTL